MHESFHSLKISQIPALKLFLFLPKEYIYLLEALRTHFVLLRSKIVSLRYDYDSFGSEFDSLGRRFDSLGRHFVLLGSSFVGENVLF